MKDIKFADISDVPGLVPLREVAKRRGWSIPHCYALMSRGKFPIRRVPGDGEVMFTEPDVRAYFLRGEITNPGLLEQQRSGRHYFQSARRKSA